MKHYRKYFIIIAVIMLLYIIVQRDNMNYFFFESVKVDTPSFVTDMTNGRRIIVDKSGQRFYMVDQDDRIHFVCHGGSTNENSFYTAYGIVTDQNDTIYLLDAQRIEGGRRIGKERIVKYDAEGNFQEVLFEVEHTEITYKNQINKIAIYNGELYYFLLNSDSFVVSDLEGNERVCQYENANVMIVSFAMSPIDGTIIFVDKTGHIMRLNEDDSLETIYYGGERGEQLSIPWNVTYGDDGTAYYTDIGLRTVNILHEDGSITPVIYGYDAVDGEDVAFEDILTQPVYYTVDCADNIETTDSYGICSVQNQELIYDTEYTYISKMLGLNFVFWLFVSILCLSTCVMLIYGLIKLLKNNKTVRTIAGLLCCTLFITAIFTMITTKNWNERMSDEMVNRARTAAELTTQLIPKEELKQISSVDDYMSEDYQAVRDCLRDIYMSDEEWVQDLYYEIYTIQNHMIVGTFSIEDYFGSIYPYDWVYSGSDEEYIMETQEPLTYKGLSTAEGSFIFVLCPIIDDTTGESLGLIEVGTDLSMFNKENNQVIFNLFLNAIVISIAAILITLEMLIFNSGHNTWKKRKMAVKPDKISTKIRRGADVPVSMLRILVFLIFFLTNMTRGFFPLYIMRLVEDGKGFAGLSSELLISTALAAEVLFGAIFSFIGDPILKWIGRRKTAIAGSIVFTGGLLLRAVVPSAFTMIAGNAIMGAGWGILLIIVQVVIAEKEEEEKNSGFAGYTASSLSGMNCGVVVGAFLVGWISEQAVFWIVALISVIALLFSIMYIYDEVPKNVPVATTATSTEAAEPKKNRMSTLRFLFSRRILSYYVMIVIPVVAGGYFLSYLYPIVAAEQGISETNIGYSYLINGIIVICMGTVLTNYMSKKFKKNVALAISAVIYAAAFVLYAYYQNTTVLMLILVLLGVSDSFGLPIQGSYYTDLPEVKEYGYEKAMGIYSLFENFSQTAGSYIFAYILMYGVKKGLFIAAGVLAGFAVLFFVLSGGLGHKKLQKAEAR